MTDKPELDTIQAFLTFLEEQDRSPQTVRAYKSDLAAFARWFEGSNGFSPTPHLVTPVDAREYRAYMLNVKRLSPGTVNRRLSALRSWMDWAVKSGLLDFNPIAHIHGVGDAQESIHWLTPQEEGKLLRAVQREVNAARTEAATRNALRNRALVVLLLNTGLRASEALALRLDDLDIGERKGEVRVRYGKRRKARTVPLNKQARQALKDWIAVRPPGEYLFNTRRSARLDNSQLRRIMATFARLSGVEFTAHSLRHTFGKRLVDAGVSLEKVAALMGHSNLNTTRIYITPGKEDLRRAVEQLEY